MFFAREDPCNQSYPAFPIYALMTPFCRLLDLVVVVVVVVVAVVVVDVDLNSATLKHFIIKRKRRNSNVVKTSNARSLLTSIIKTVCVCGDAPFRCPGHLYLFSAM